MDPQTLFAFAAVISGIDLQVEVDGTRVSGEMTVAVELAPPPAELSDPADGGAEAALERMARDNKHVQVRTLKKTGHYPHLERPNAFAALVQSLLVRSK